MVAICIKNILCMSYKCIISVLSKLFLWVSVKKVKCAIHIINVLFMNKNVIYVSYKLLFICITENVSDVRNMY